MIKYTRSEKADESVRTALLSLGITPPYSAHACQETLDWCRDKDHQTSHSKVELLKSKQGFWKGKKVSTIINETVYYGLVLLFRPTTIRESQRILSEFALIVRWETGGTSSIDLRKVDEVLT